MSASKTRLANLTKLAFERGSTDEAFTMEEVNAYFDAIKEAFGENEASGVLNLVLATIKSHGYTGQQFGLAFTVTLYEQRTKQCKHGYTNSE